MLTPIEEFGSAEVGVSRPVEGSTEHRLVIQTVHPGRYRVRVESAVGFAASVLYGGTDLLHEPLVVGSGGLSSPIEVTLRDDGAKGRCPRTERKRQTRRQIRHALCNGPGEHSGLPRRAPYCLPLAVILRLLPSRTPRWASA